jgi:hypothetical protein
VGTKRFLKSRDERKRVEMRSAHLKIHNGFERMRLRGLSGACDRIPSRRYRAEPQDAGASSPRHPGCSPVRFTVVREVGVEGRLGGRPNVRTCKAKNSVTIRGFQALKCSAELQPRFLRKRFQLKIATFSTVSTHLGHRTIRESSPTRFHGKGCQTKAG